MPFFCMAEKQRMSNATSQGSKMAKTSVKASAKAGAKFVKTGINLFAPISSYSNPVTIIIKMALTNPIILTFFGICLFVAILVGGTSGYEMDKTWGLHPLGQESTYTASEETKEANEDKSKAQEQSLEMLEIVNKATSDKYDEVLENVKAKAKKEGIDENEAINNVTTQSLGYNDIEGTDAKVEGSFDSSAVDSDDNKDTTVQDKEDSDTKGKVIQNFDLSMATNKNLTFATYENYFRKNNGTWGWAEGTFQGKYAGNTAIYASPSAGAAARWMMNDDTLEVDKYGYIKDKKTGDFLIAMGSYFGKVGNRYRITFKNGASYTFLKFDEKADKDTDSQGFAHGSDGSVIEFLVDQKGKENKLHSSVSRSGNAMKRPDNIFSGGIVKIELIEGEVDTTSAGDDSVFGSKILAAFSVKYNNKFFAWKNDSIVIDDEGNEIEFDEDDKKPQGPAAGYVPGASSVQDSVAYKMLHDPEGQLKDDLKEADWELFYSVEYEVVTVKAEPQKISKEEYDNLVSLQQSYEEKREANDAATGFYEEGEIQEITQEEKDAYSLTLSTVGGEYYKTAPDKKMLKTVVTPHNIDSIALEVFNLDPDAEYYNEKREKDEDGNYIGTKITNQKVVDSMAQETRAVLFDDNGTGEIGDGVLRGDYMLPLAPGSYRISQEFGSYPNNGYNDERGHTGIDLAVPQGSTVYAANGGTVIFSGKDNLGGRVVKIKHPDGATTWYYHLSQSLVKAGQKVSKGQVIGKSGGQPGTDGAGMSTGAHLHFEYHAPGGNGAAYDDPKLSNPRNIIAF